MKFGLVAQPPTNTFSFLSSYRYYWYNILMKENELSTMGEIVELTRPMSDKERLIALCAAFNRGYSQVVSIITHDNSHDHGEHTNDESVTEVMLARPSDQDAQQEISEDDAPNDPGFT